MSSTTSRADTLHLIAGRACLDLVNTVSWRGDPARAQDHLALSADCLTWLARVGILTDTEATELAGTDSRPALVALRRALDASLTDDTQFDPAPLQPAIRDALDHSTLVRTHDRAAWEVAHLTAHTAGRRLALDLLDLLTHPTGPIRSCGDPACGWVFIDTSRGHRRRWCSSADCGNRERVRRHTART